MEIRKLTCPKCGGTVKLDGSLSGGACPACGMKFGLGSEAPLTVPEKKAPAAPTPEPAPDYRPGAPAARGQLSMADKKRENDRRDEAAKAAEAANNAAKEAAAVQKPADTSVSDARLKSAFRAINAKQWMRADAILNDILKNDPDNAEALRGKRLVAGHRTEEKAPETPAPAPAPAEPTVVAAPFPMDELLTALRQNQAQQQQQQPAAAPDRAPDIVVEEVKEDAVTPVLVPENEIGRDTESEIADTDRRMTARLSDNIDRKRNQKLLSKSNRALAKRKWKKAERYADEILATDPESAYAYRNKLLAELKLPEERYLAEYEGNLSDHRFFLLALNYSTGSLNRRLMDYADASTRSALVIERSQAIREMERLRQAEADTDRRVAEINASLPEDFNDEDAEKERNRRISKILDRADEYRERKKWNKAERLYNEALAIDGECADAYLGLLLVSLRLKQEKKLAHCTEPFGTDPNFLLAMHYGSRVMRRRLERYLASAGQQPASSSSMVVAAVPAVEPVAYSSASSAGLEELRAEMNHRLDGIEQMIANSNRQQPPIIVENPMASVPPEEIARRLDEAEREVYLTRIAAAELAAADAKDSEERRAELLGRLHEKEEEVIRLRAAMKDAEAVTDNDYFTSELRDTEEKLDPLFRKARKLHKRGKFERAEDKYKEILTLDPTNGAAYLGLLLCDLKIRKEKNLDKSTVSFSSDENYALAVRFSEPATAKRLKKTAEKVDERLGIVDGRNSAKKSRSQRKRIEEQKENRRSVLIRNAERKAEENRINGLHLSQREEDKALAEAEKLMKRDKFARARVILDETLEKSPDFAGAYIARLECTLSCRTFSELGKVSRSYRYNEDFILGYYFGKRATRRRLNKLAAKADKRAEKRGNKDAESLDDLRAVELDEERRDRELLYRQSGDYAEKRRVKNDVYAVKAAAALPGRKMGDTDPAHEKQLKRGYKYLKRRKWNKANGCFEKIRSEDPANCRVYIGLLLASLALREEKDLGRVKTPISSNRYYLLALCCADAKTAERLREYAERADRRYGKKSEPTPATYTDLVKRREDVNRRRIENLEKKNRELEAELARKKNPNLVYAGKDPDSDPDYLLHDGGRFASLKVTLFFLAVALGIALLAAAAILIFRYNGNVANMIDAIKRAFGK